MQTNAIVENTDGFRWDLFINKVCNALMLSEEIKQRAKPLYEGNNLTVLTASKEDVFLFKGITEREADLDDMRILAESGLDWKLISKECQTQSAAAGVPWEMALSQNLQDLNERIPHRLAHNKGTPESGRRKARKTLQNDFAERDSKRKQYSQRHR